MNYNKASDKELIECCKKNDIKAYNVLFDRYVARLNRIGMQYLKKDETIVEELVMDVMLNLWDRRKEIQLEGSLSSYLFKAMHNKAISHLRMSTPVMVDIRNLPEDSFVDDCSTDHGLILNDINTHYEKLLRQLSPQRQTAFRLSREEGLSYTDIAAEMKLSPNTVKNHINAGLDYFRHHYKSTVVITLYGLLTFLLS